MTTVTVERVVEIRLQQDEGPDGLTPWYYQVSTFENDERGYYVPDSSMPAGATYDFGQAVDLAVHASRDLGIDRFEWDVV